MDTNSPIVHKTRTQVVVEVLRERILSGDIEAGKPLRQSALASELNVSRIPIREALLQLEAEGLVKFEAHKGATAAALSSEQVCELFELRALIETDLLAKSIVNMNSIDIEQARAILTKLEESFSHANSSNLWSELNTEFHTSLYKAANRPNTMEVVQNLNSNCDRYIRLHLLRKGGIPKAEQQHQQLLALCEAKDVEGACALLKEHILGSAQDLIELVDAHNHSSS
ncbi:GntR family transcriptional regulator [Psychrobium sp. 1_MG-2023]|uniref:GntR family transcriptional regulator n=1 Tax=Psychrobium sp. 1_MG-2023 TaxID=3062624 RepID=UPI000C346F52|nr:GntR family transcriptional regulator [Psychrobium sp. 1_MG-2023]MDP2562497.1 GntR family transcriptional regulator [Psychrobium sp. 1_MG-2023]PKF54330.1 GntR family transcriptional regulator [Alteromonadales bacterium alter-6D02]